MSRASPNPSASTLRVLISGASSGIGRALALHYACSGAKLVLIARRAQALEELAELVRERGGEALALPVDVADSDALVAAVAEGESRFAGVDLAIACAGRGHSMQADASTEDFAALENTLSVNYLAAVRTLYALLPGMIERGCGALCAITSVAAIRGLAGSAGYSASKSALAAHMEALRVELRGTPISVTTVAPGFVKTAMVEELDGPLPFMVSPERAAALIARAIRRKRSHYVFPWQMRWLTRFMRVLPNAIFDPLSARAIGENRMQR